MRFLKFILFIFFVIFGAYSLHLFTNSLMDVGVEDEDGVASRSDIEQGRDSGRGLDVSRLTDRFANWVNTGAVEREKMKRDQQEEQQDAVSEIKEEAEPSQDDSLELILVEQKKEEVGKVDGAYKTSFLQDQVVGEVPREELSENEQWWVSSGGELLISDGVAKTITGDLDETSEWFEPYSIGSNALITDGGRHPQNIFRVVQRDTWTNFSQEVYFYNERYNESESAEREASNGVFLMNRYIDQDNLYYVGFRVDGTVVIKKKVEGVYHTIYTDTLFEGVYDRDTNPSLLPEKTWIGLRSVMEDIPGGQVNIKVYIDRDRRGSWELLGSALDDGKTYGGEALTSAGKAGLRSDFMDVWYDDYSATDL